MSVTVEGVREHLYAYRVLRLVLRVLPEPPRGAKAPIAGRPSDPAWVREMAATWARSAAEQQWEARRLREKPRPVERWRCRQCRTWRIGDRTTHRCQRLKRLA